MFTNLIESNAHGREFKRRSSFFFATVAGYALILFAAGVVGVLTYDAQVEAQTTDILVEIAPPMDRVEKPERPAETSPVRRPKQANAPVDPNVTESVRTTLVATTNNPLRVPEGVGIKPSSVLPVNGPVRLGNRNVDPPPSVTPNVTGCVACPPVTPKVVETETAPLPPTPKQSTLRVSPGVIIAKIVSLPKPVYPPLAKSARVHGAVNVQILIDETGKVISAHAVKGSPMLTTAAVEAALRARFTPTKLGEAPVKVQGVITYNFVLQ